jgi:hypothetical protein
MKSVKTQALGCEVIKDPNLGGQKKSHLIEMTFFAQIMKKLLLKNIK